MKQHYLPRFYLQGFTDPEAKEGHEPHVWLYSTHSARWRKRAPKNVATKKDLYSVTGEDGERNDQLENLLSLVESEAARIISNRIEKGETLDAPDRDAMAYFLAFMSNRLPAFLDRWSRSVVEDEIARMELLRSHPEAFEALKKEAERATSHKFPDWFGPEHFDPKRYRIVPDKGFILSLALAPVNQMAYILSDMSWVFFTTPVPRPFITSDYPLCAFNPRLSGTPYGPGLLQEHVEITIPLSSAFALLVTWAGPATTYCTAQTPDVRAINLRTMSGAKEIIVSPKRDFPGSEKVAAWARHKWERPD